MSQPRFATRVDHAQKPIVDALRHAGCSVEIIGKPVDLLVRHPSFPPGIFMLMEIKSPFTKSGKPRARKDQKAQEEFCREHGVPYVLSPEGALQVVRTNVGGFDCLNAALDLGLIRAMYGVEIKRWVGKS